MFLSVALFELRKNFRRISTYVYFLVLFAIGFLIMIAAGGVFQSVQLDFGGGGKTHANSPYALAQFIGVISYFAMLISGGMMGQSIYQDFHNRISPFFFTSPISKSTYLLGRFSGSFCTLLLINMGAALGCYVGTWLPLLEATRIGPNHLSAYALPFLYMVLPNLLFTSALFFGMAALGRRMLPVYLTSVFLLLGYLIASVMVSQIENKFLASLLDPFGFTAMDTTTQYWTVAERNQLQLPMAGALLYNRLLWLAVGAAGLAATLWAFRAGHHAEGGKNRHAALNTAEVPPGSFAAMHGKAGAVGPAAVSSAQAPAAALAAANQAAASGQTSRLRLLWTLAWLGFKETVKNVYFVAIVSAGVLFMIFASQTLGALFGTETYPVTYAVLQLVGGSFTLFVLIVITYYSGELVWRERDANVHQLCDVLPIPSWVPFAAKILALLGVQVLLLCVVMVTGICIQAAQGYFKFEIGQYVTHLFGLRLVDYGLLSVLAVVVHVIVNQKYLGHFVMVLYYMASIAMSQFGFEHKLFDYGGTPGVTYSDMNGFGHFLYGIRWFQLHWAIVAVVMTLIASLFWVRGTESGLKARVKIARSRWDGRFAATLTGCLLLAVGTGSYIYYNTAVLNVFRTSYQSEQRSVKYETTYGHLRHEPQPRVTAVTFECDLFPAERRVLLKGTYTLVNKHQVPIKSVYVSVPESAVVNTLEIAGVEDPAMRDDTLSFYRYDLPEALAAGATTTLAFDLAYQSVGFRNSSDDTDIVDNGTFFNSGYMPALGYNEDAELSDDDARRRFDLPPKSLFPPVDDPVARQNNYISNDADWITLDAVVSTDADQVAIVPGYLQKEELKDGRRTFHYRTDGKILHFFSVLSARYQVLRDTWKPGPHATPGTPAEVAIEIYYHPGHEYNLARMVRGIKLSLDYYTAHFSPYQHRQVRIIEFPRYAQFAQSFPNTIPFSESIGFIAKVDALASEPSATSASQAGNTSTAAAATDDSDDIDYPFYVTAHEVAHQWWAHQVIGARVQGCTLMSESLSQYSALMVMKHAYGADHMRRFLRYELDQYLQGRGLERKKELPLARNENQQYIHYNKGSLVLYALQDYLGETKVNQALAAYIKRVGYQEPPYTNADEFLEEIRKVTPPDMQSLVDDMFLHITLFENRAVSATWKKLQDGQYEVTLQIKSEKLRAGDLGEESAVPGTNLIDIGVRNKTGAYLYRQKHPVAAGESTLTLTVKEQPATAGIDPLNILVDRRPDDNLVPVLPAE